MAGGTFLPNLSAEVTMDQVREEVQRQLKAEEAEKQKEFPKSIDQLPGARTMT